MATQASAKTNRSETRDIPAKSSGAKRKTNPNRGKRQTKGQSRQKS
jgi:hypothetical protein